jgi:hypothetical protein
MFTVSAETLKRSAISSRVSNPRAGVARTGSGTGGYVDLFHDAALERLTRARHEAACCATAEGHLRVIVRTQSMHHIGV